MAIGYYVSMGITPLRSGEYEVRLVFREERTTPEQVLHVEKHVFSAWPEAERFLSTIERGMHDNAPTAT